MPKKDRDNTFEELVPSKLLDEVKALHKKSKTGDEFEVMFFNYKQGHNRMGMESFIRVLEYITYRSKARKLELVNTTTLDINYVLSETGECYRITVSGLDSINKYMEMLHLRKSHVIFSVLAGMTEEEDDVTIQKKEKNHDHMVDVDDFNVRFRLSKEGPLNKTEMKEMRDLSETERNKITFRYKQRTSLILKGDKDTSFQIDLTNTKMSTDINRLHRTAPIYELEIDYLRGKNGEIDLADIYKEINILLKVLQQSNYIINIPVEDEVLNVYGNLVGVNREKMFALDIRKTVSLEVQHVVDKLPNRYAVTDKADGERYFLLIHKSRVYLISDTLHVKDTGIELGEKQKDYDNTLLDGEYVFIRGSNRYVFLAFDCLYHKGDDIRKEASFMKRLEYVDEVVEKCFVAKDQRGFKFSEYKGKFDPKKIVEFHNKQIGEHMSALNNDLKQDKGFPLIRRKYFISVFGGQNNEIFKYAELMWKMYVYEDKVNCPYILDGLIFHPLDQKYITSAQQSTYVEYKWKPPEKNSIDFYVQFERSRETNNILVLYDNSREEYVRGKAYKIGRLHVGKTGRSGEQPTLFRPEINKHRAHMFLQDGEVRDQEGKVIQDKTVVEFYYNNDPNIPEEHRWVPIRTRYDKTESVKLYRRKFGNYGDVANRIWRSIENPVLMSDFTILSNDDQYDKHIGMMRGKIDHSVILSERQENQYYQIATNLAKGMRAFHNFIKSNIIYTHCNPTYEQDRHMSVLDIGCGRGGDLMKFYYVEPDFYVGIDKDNAGLISPVDGAISRYNKFRKAYPRFPNMFFINADAGVLLTPDEQTKAIGSMTKQNVGLMHKFFSKDANRRTMFDRINCQFTLHYLLQNETVWDNFIQNINMYLKPGGSIMITTFDAHMIRKLLAEKGQFTALYTDKKGSQRVMFEIVKKYDEKEIGDVVGLGVPIDVHNATYMQEGNYQTEYLVDKNFLASEFSEKCEMSLTESDTFENQFFIHQEFFKGYADYEENPQTRKFLTSPLPFYDMKDEDNRAAFQFSRLNRLYVFRKAGTTYKAGKVKDKSKSEPKSKPKKKSTTKKQKGGARDIAITDIDHYLKGKIVRRDLDCPDSYSFLASVHDTLRTDNMIPENIEMPEFYNDLGYKMVRDGTITKRDIGRLCKNLVIGHDFSASDLTTEIALDKINMLVLERDCDDDFEVRAFGAGTTLDAGVPTILLYKDGTRYSPMYRMDGGKSNGLFDTRSAEIKTLIKESDGKLGPVKRGIKKSTKK